MIAPARFLALIDRLADRFVTERSFELIVSPAMADFEYDVHRGNAHPPLRSYAAVLRALAGAIVDEAIEGGTARTFLGLTAIPFCYYAFFFLLGFPAGINRLPYASLTVLAAAVVVLSVAPVLVCFWPERGERRTRTGAR